MIADVPQLTTQEVLKLETGSSFITVEMQLWTLNSGSTLIAYELWRDDGRQGELVLIYSGLERVQRVTQGIVEGRTYRFMYRVRNDKGLSEFSKQTYILAASAPAKPLKAPALVSVDAT